MVRRALALAGAVDPASATVDDGRWRGTMTDPNRSWPAVSKTALGMALIRADESRRPDRLFDDPFAEAFLAASPEAFADEEGATTDPTVFDAVFRVFSFHGVIRTRFFDDYLLAASAAGCHQVGLLAAGLDTRAFRLAWPPGVEVFELDLPDALRFKDQVLAGQPVAPGCERTAVPVDLRHDWATTLTEAGFDATEPTAWLAEGLFVYLSASEAAQVLESINELSAPRSQLALDDGGIADAFLLAQAETMPGMQQFSTLWKDGLSDDALTRLAQNAWDVATYDVRALAEAYHRLVPDHARGRLVTALCAD